MNSFSSSSGLDYDAGWRPLLGLPFDRTAQLPDAGMNVLLVG